MEAWGEHEAIPGQTSPAEQPPREQGPHGTTRGPVNRPQVAEPRGAEPRGAGNTPRTSLSERMKHFISAPLAKPIAGVCQRYFMPPRDVPSTLFRWREHVPVLMTWTHAIGTH